MIIALSLAYDEGTFAVHYAAADTLEQAQTWCEQRGANLAAQGTEHSSAVFNTEHVQRITDCNVDEPGAKTS